MDDQSVIESGRNDKGQWVSKQVIQQAAQRALAKQAADTAKARAQVQSLTQAWAKQEKHIAKLASIQQKLTRTQIKDLKQVEKAMQKSMTAQMREYRKLAREKVRAARGGRGSMFGGGGLGFGGLGTTIISTAAIYATVRKVMDMSAPFLTAEINRRGASADIQRAMAGIKNVPLSAGAGLVSQYQGLGKAQFLGAGAEQIKGLTRLQSELAKGMGVERATELVKSLAESYGDATDRLNAFLTAAGSGNIRQVLEQFASGTNIVETTKAINALGIATDASKGKLDPLVQTNLTLTTTIDKLNATLENFVNNLLPKVLPYLEKGADLIDKWATALSKMDVSTLALIAGGGLVGGRLLLGGGGGLKLAGRGLIAAGGALTANPIGAAIGAGVVGSLAIDKLRDNRGLGAMGWYVESLKAQSDLSSLAESRAEQFRTKRDATTDPLQQLRYRRAEISAYISKENDPQKLQSLRTEWAQLSKQIATMKTETAKAEPKGKSLWDTLREGAEKATDAVKQYAAKVQDAANADKVAKLQQLAKQQQQAQLNAQVAGSQTELARAKLDLARTNFFGPQMGMMNSIPECRRAGKLDRVRAGSN